MKELAMVSTRAVAPVVAGLKAAGADVQRALEIAELTLDEVSDAQGRVPHERVVRLWSAAAEMTGDADLGLRIAAMIPPGNFGVSEFAFRKSANLREGIARISRYFRLGHDVARMDGEISGDHYVYEHTLPGARSLPRAATDFVLSCAHLIIQDAVAEPVALAEVWLDYAEPTDTAALQERFRAPLKFRSGKRALVFSVEDLEMPLRDSEPGLCGVLDAHAQQLLASLPPVGTFSDRVRELLASQLAGGDATAQDVARTLKMSVRTLHRRLVEEGTTHKKLLEDLRRELAGTYLSEQAIGISEVAYLLGFSEPSAFHRAFRRWTGKTPAEFRSARLA